MRRKRKIFVVELVYYSESLKKPLLDGGSLVLRGCVAVLLVWGFKALQTGSINVFTLFVWLHNLFTWTSVFINEVRFSGQRVWACP